MNKLVVLCIDDEATVLDSLRIELKKALKGQCIIETAEGGKDALNLVSELQEDGYEVALVLSDYIMPDIKGDEVLKRIHDISPKTLKIMLTGQANLKAVGNAIKHARLYRYISKPWQTEDLKLTIFEALHSYLQDKKLTERNLKLHQLNQAYERFIPHQFLQLLNKESIVDVELGDHVEKEMSVLFADIRNFTVLSETMSTEDNFKFINSYLSLMEPAISNNQGFIDKYIGDEIMALFNGDVDDAVQAAIAMLHRLTEYNRTRQRPGRLPFQVGIGINTGSLMLGTVGGQERLDGTVISDTVNLASRLEKLTKKYGVSLLISHFTFSQLKNLTAYAIRLIDRVQVKGKSELVSVFEVFDADPPDLLEGKSDTRTAFEQAVSLYYLNNVAKAAQLFSACLSRNPRDRAAKIYLERCQLKIEQIPS